MSRLKDGIPRAFTDHRRKESRVYGEAVRGICGRFSKIPPSVRPLVKEYGRVVVELHQNGPALERAIERGRLTEARRLRREAKALRFLMMKLYGQIEQLAGVQAPADLARAIANDLTEADL